MLQKHLDIYIKSQLNVDILNMVGQFNKSFILLFSKIYYACYMLNSMLGTGNTDLNEIWSLHWKVLLTSGEKRDRNKVWIQMWWDSRSSQDGLTDTTLDFLLWTVRK